MNRSLFGKKRKVTVLLGNIDDGVTNTILHCITHACSGEYVVTISSGQAPGLLGYAHSQKFDFCVMVLNNIVFPIIPWPLRRQKVLEFVTELKQGCRSPIIAFAGITEDVSLPEAAVRAGASYFFWMPFSPPDFVEAVRTCLSAKDNLL